MRPKVEAAPSRPIPADRLPHLSSAMALAPFGDSVGRRMRMERERAGRSREEVAGWLGMDLEVGPTSSYQRLPPQYDLKYYE